MADVLPEGFVEESKEDKRDEKEFEKRLKDMDARGEIELVSNDEPEENASEDAPAEVEPPTGYTIGGKNYTEDELLKYINTPAPEKVTPELESKNTALQSKLKELRDEASGDPTILKMLDMIEPLAGEVEHFNKLKTELETQKQIEHDRNTFLKQKAEAEAKHGVKIPDLNDPELRTFIEFQTTATLPELWMAYKGKSQSPTPRKVLRDRGEDEDAPTNEFKREQMKIAKKLGISGRYIK